MFLEATRRNFEEKQDKLLFKMHDDLSYEVFCCLLNRMMKHKMGYYYDYSKYDEQYYFKFARDNYKMKNKTYLDYFKVQTLDRKFYKSIEEIRRKREDMGIEKDYEYEEYILTGTICIY